MNNDTSLDDSKKITVFKKKVDFLSSFSKDSLVQLIRESKENPVNAR